jgi:CBS domain-containing protein
VRGKINANINPRRVIFLQVKDIMTRSVAYINPDSTVTEAAQLMQKHNVGSIPVCDQSGVIGMVTDRDIVVRNVAHGTDPHKTPVKQVMTSQVTTVEPDMDLNQVSDIMSKNQIRRLPVVENNKLIGIVALGDLATDGKYVMEASDTLTDISKPSKPEKM